MSNLVCFNKDNFYISIVFLIFITFLFIVFFPENYINIKHNKRNKIKEKYLSNKKINKKENISNLSEKKNINHQLSVNNVLKRDTDVVYSSLNPPERRQPIHISSQLPTMEETFIRSREDLLKKTDNYHLLGNCIRKSDEKIVNLYGRQKYPGSNIYEYYGEAKDSSGMNVKFKISTIRNNELYNNDQIDIPMFDTSKGKFVVHLYDYELPRYNPYLF